MPTKDDKRKNTPRVRNLIAFSLLIMLLFCEVVIYQSSQAYRTALEDAKANSKRLSRIMSQQIEMTLLNVDSTLHRAVEHQYYNDLFGGNLPDYILNNMQTWVDESPRIGVLALVDENGKSVVAAHKREFKNWMDYTKHSFAQDELFIKLREGKDTDYFIGKMEGSLDHGKSLLVMARKITRVDGSFGGVFIAALDPAFFVEYFRSVDQGSLSYISLQLLNSGLMLVNSDRGVAQEDHSEIDQLVLKRSREKALQQVGMDSITKHNSIEVFTYQTLKSLPVLITVVLDQEDYLKGWRQNRLKDLGFLTIFTVFGSVLSFFALTMARQIVRVEESEAAAVLASQAKSEFLANMSHELRTPLNAIIGFSEMLNSGYFGPLNPKQKERVYDINLCGTHLLHLITDILEFSKGDAGKLELVEEKVIMQDLVNETLRMMQDKIKNKHMNILIDVDNHLPVMLGDKRKIRQIMLNLLSNSLKFTPEEGTIKISAKLDNTKNMTLTVSDTGIGIAEDDIPVALSVFGQVHRSQSHEGTGLGLPLCKMFAELHGGKLALGSTVGEGTTVRVIFPATRNLPDTRSGNEATA